MEVADEIRRAVAIDVGLGIPKINEHTMPGFQWPALDFGWSLAEDNDGEVREKTINDILQEKEDAAAEAFEIGTWSNDMASSIPESSEFDDLMEPLPSNLTFCTSASGKHKYAGKNFAMADSDDSFMSSLSWCGKEAVETAGNR
uniref:Uncharacterized protein n=1 Tax=Heliothis virescens TaxID=7102 RepID=A0A2A4K8D5_HELVI